MKNGATPRLARAAAGPKPQSPGYIEIAHGAVTFKPIRDRWTDIVIPLGAILASAAASPAPSSNDSDAEPPAMLNQSQATEQARQEYDAYAPLYDRETGWYERAMLGDGRAWACSQARGEVLEVAIGTGLNLPHYPPDIRLTGMDLSPRMLTRAHARARQLNLPARMVEGDAQELPFSDATFDTVICTLGLSSIPDDHTALREMHRVLRHGGYLVLLGHVASPHPPIRAVQHLIERAAARTERPTDQQMRQTTPPIRQAGFTILYRSRRRGGIIERLVATRTMIDATPTRRTGIEPFDETQAGPGSGCNQGSYESALDRHDQGRQGVFRGRWVFRATRVSRPAATTRVRKSGYPFGLIRNRIIL